MHLPDDKDIVIDAKVSLVGYERFTAAVDDSERATALVEHLGSLRRHIDWTFRTQLRRHRRLAHARFRAAVRTCRGGVHRSGACGRAPVSAGAGEELCWSARARCWRRCAPWRTCGASNAATSMRWRSPNAPPCCTTTSRCWSTNSKRSAASSTRRSARTRARCAVSPKAGRGQRAAAGAEPGRDGRAG